MLNQPGRFALLDRAMMEGHILAYEVRPELRFRSTGQLWLECTHSRVDVFVKYPASPIQLQSTLFRIPIAFDLKNKEVIVGEPQEEKPKMTATFGSGDSAITGEIEDFNPKPQAVLFGKPVVFACCGNNIAHGHTKECGEKAPGEWK